ncbi:hypothetical protein GCM10008018_14680 [Paenibacillus marchantiophytorum]|uniref:Spore germination protein n=1 Tax=Paenibacillus marchantiophytorum TaxID=1619310 RepID=A0ABQ2BRN3_9BACL|nr:MULTISPECIES: hypothetical protein [Paenibacillus]UKS24864.1 hypothetical protein LOZ80_25065 [Paenibacillus sp. HWE-109]GGI45949.1 hypothetical protein GCM10008018_14680 [Paenibacillus marchantiophytorum]
MSSFMSPSFIIGSIRIGSVESASCINMGNNWPTDFQSNQKTVQGFGAVEGDNNQLVGTRSMLNDSDFMDMLNIGDNETPDWLQEMIVNQAQTSGFTTSSAASETEPAVTNAPQTAD